MQPPRELGKQGRLRDRRAVRGALSLAGARGAAILLSVVSVPLTLPHLGAERFGLWMTINAIVALMSFSDLGLGNGLMTLVADADGRDDTRSASVQTSSAFFALAGLAVALGLGFAVLYPYVPWPELYNVSSDLAASEAGTATAIALACFLATLPLGVVKNLQLGYQDALRKGLWDTAANLLALVGIVVVVASGGSLPWLVAAFAGAPVLAGLANSAHWFTRVRPRIRPRWKLVRRPVALQLVRLGAVYMVLQLAAMVAFFSDALILAQILGPEAVADYSVAWKLFSVVSLTFTLALMPLWPAYTEAAARRDTDWVRATLKRSIRLTLLVTVPASCALLALGGPIIELWTGSRVDPPFELLAALAVWTVVWSGGTALAMFMNALRVVRIQLIAAVAMAVTNVGLSIALTEAIGITGVIVGTLASYTLVALLPLGLAVPRILADLERQRVSEMPLSPVMPPVRAADAP